MTNYPKPITPLPWRASGCLSDCDVPYLIHAANAFPHLVKALEAMVNRWEPDTEGLDRIMWENACKAIAIARGEMKP